MLDILMAAYNGEKFIEQQLKSIADQSYTEWKLLISDDCSADATMEKIKAFLSENKSVAEKTTVLDGGRRFGSARDNFFYLMRQSSSEYVMFCDQDDVWEKDKIAQAVRCMGKMEEKYGKDVPLLAHSDLKVVDEELNIIHPSMFAMEKLDSSKRRLNDLLVQNNVTGCTVICNRALIDICTQMPEDVRMHDWWLALAASAFGRIGYMSEPHILYRQHGGNSVGAKNVGSISYIIKRVFDRKNVKASLEETYAQAEIFRNVFAEKLDDEKREVLDAYISMRTAGKFKKYRLMKKYGFMKSGFNRKLGYILYV